LPTAPRPYVTRLSGWADPATRGAALLRLRRRAPAVDTLSLHDALPIYDPAGRLAGGYRAAARALWPRPAAAGAIRDMARPGRIGDRKSTRLNSSHVKSSYAVFCLKKKRLRTGLRSCAASRGNRLPGTSL